jgi:hypothetical protein
MRKTFLILCLFGVLSALNSQDTEISDNFNNIQKKIESLKARMSLLQQNEKVFPKIQKPVSLTTETSEPKEDSTKNVIKQGSDDTDIYQLLKKVNELKSRVDPLNQKLDSLTDIQENQIPDPERATPVIQKETKQSNYFEKQYSIEDEKNKPKFNFSLNNEPTNNSLNFYTGFVMPNKSKFRKYGIQFEEGEQYSIEYIRKFGSFFLGSTLSTKLYENKKITGIKVDDRIKGDSSDYIHLVDTGQIKSSGKNRSFALSISTGWEPYLSDRIFMRNKVNMGMAFSEKEIKIEEHILTQSDSVFYYSFLSGIGVQWTNLFHTLFYYQFDGQSEVERFNDQTFHEIGISFGINY